MSRQMKDFTVLALLTFGLTFLVWLPHLLTIQNFWGLQFNLGFNTIYRNFDGLEYIVIAKTFYDPQAITALPQSLSPQYYASHFPGFSLAILIFAPILGFLKSMLFVSVFFTFLSVLIFYYLIKEFNLSNQPLFLSALFLILPARWLIVHSVGSSEPMFIFFIILAIFLFMKFEFTKKYHFLLLSALAGFMAQITRPPGILLFIALSIYVLVLILRNIKHQGFVKSFISHLKYFPLTIIPLGLLGIFSWYQNAYGDFFAYFHSGDNIHLIFPPFQVFNKYQFWVGDIWLEDIVYTFILGLLGGVYLLKKKLYPMAYFVLTYLVASTLVAHRDISRYILPITPFILIAFEKVLTSREFKIILPLIALAIYLYAQNFLLANIAPIANLNSFN